MTDCGAVSPEGLKCVRAEGHNGEHAHLTPEGEDTYWAGDHSGRELIGRYEHVSVWGKPGRMTVSFYEDRDSHRSDRTIDPVDSLSVGGVEVLPIQGRNIHHFSLAGDLFAYRETSPDGDVQVEVVAEECA